jgi:hypothetical protein
MGDMWTSWIIMEVLLVMLLLVVVVVPCGLHQNLRCGPYRNVAIVLHRMFLTMLLVGTAIV